MIKLDVDIFTFFCFDLDDTLITSVDYFGSEKWETDIKNNLICKGVCSHLATKQAMKLWQEAQKKTKIKWRSDKIYNVFFEIQNCTDKWCILTARDEKMKQITANQIMKSLNFEKKHQYHTMLNRLIFCSGNQKAKFLKDFFRKNKMNNIKKIIVFDDREENIDNIKSSFNTIEVFGCDLNRI